jgi:hypothetical protein
MNASINGLGLSIVGTLTLGSYTFNPNGNTSFQWGSSYNAVTTGSGANGVFCVNDALTPACNDVCDIAYNNSNGIGATGSFTNAAGELKFGSALEWSASAGNGLVHSGNSAQVFQIEKGVCSSGTPMFWFDIGHAELQSVCGTMSTFSLQNLGDLGYSWCQ